MTATSPARSPLLHGQGTGPALLAGYVLLYLALDWVSFIHPMRGLNITPWNPQSALAVALLWWRPSAWWLVSATLLLGHALLRGVADFWPAEVVACALLAVGYVLTAAALRRWLHAEPRMSTRRDFLRFVLVVGFGSLAGALLYVLGLAAFGIPQPDRIVPAVTRAWIGDTVGFLVTLPLLMMLANDDRRRQTRAMLQSIEWWLVALLSVAFAYAVFMRPAEEQFKFFYLLFVPVVWGAARFGVTGAVCSAAFVQGLLIVAVQSAEYRPLTVFELQMLMSALAATGLLLGTTVDEREATAQALRQSLHLAAAGDMAAALAHELNQPLTALSTYARASQLLARRLGDESQLADVTNKLVNEANRASEVVKRLRDFFRDRVTDLRLTDIEPVVRGVVDTKSARAASVKVRLACDFEPGLPSLWLDRVQIEVVLRNLIANAIDAALQTPKDDAWVEVGVRSDSAHVLVMVCDSGPGVAAEDVDSVFESRASSKPGGMGIGLSISRSIVQAHGGRLWAEPGPGGRFFFQLPAARPQP